MITAASYLHYGSLATTLALTGLGVAIGQGRITKAATDDLYVQPQAHRALSKNLLLSLALTETSALISLIMIIIIFFGTRLSAPNALYISIAQAGIMCAVGLVGLVISIVSSMPAIASMHAIARQPFFAEPITNMMLVTISIIQTPIIFGFITVFMIHLRQDTLLSLNESLKILASAICVGIGSIGPAIGQGLFARNACESVGINRLTYKRIFSFALLSQSFIETPIILAFFASLLMLLNMPTDPTILKTIAIMASAGCIGVANLMPGIGSGRIAAAACTQVGQQTPANAAAITRASLLAQGLVDTLAIYGLLIGLMLMFFA